MATKETCHISSKFSEGTILQFVSSSFILIMIFSAFSKVNCLEFKSSEFYLAGMLN